MGGRELADALARAAIEAVEPRRCTREAIARVGIDRPVTLFALGKAARGMAEAALASVEVTRGIVLAPDDVPLAHLTVRRGGHPLPSPDAVAHGDEVLALARSMGEDDLALVLISGGGSSMLERPIEGVSLAELAATSRALMDAGVDIAGLNAVRRCLSQIKGGGLARAIAPARVIAIVISDVPGHPASVVASGPCSQSDDGPDPREVLARSGAEVSPAVRAAIPRRTSPPPLANVRFELAASNEQAVLAVRAEAAARGIALAVCPDPISGDAAAAARDFVERGRAMGGLVGGGETTVALGAARGRGGRNQHAALSIACGGEALLGDGTFVAIATDGVDGSSDAAGAYLDREVLVAAHDLGLDPGAFLAARDSHGFFERVGARIVTGPTGTNVADVWCLIPGSRG